MEKVQDTTPSWQKGANCMSDRTSGYERLARYGGKGATQREAELCALSTHRCHLFPPNSLAEIASRTRVEHWNLRLYIH